MKDGYITTPRRIIIEGIESAFPLLGLEDLDQIDGNPNALVLKLQEKCGYSKETAEVEVILFLRDLGIIR
jgi:hypothetical protein